MTPLERALRERISADGPMTVEAFMEACNSYYYATRDPLGADGDFTTAPEISQIFGEMVGACLADCWSRAGGEPDVIYVELGPGRGTLAADALRAIRSAGFDPNIHFVETSPILRHAQSKAVPNAEWHGEISALPDRPMLLVANEFLDALAVRQHVAGVERKIVIAAGGLAFDRDGEIVESSPARDEAVAGIAKRLAANGGVAILIDYGHAKGAAGDTLQAVRGHRFSPVLDKPGEQDLTAHVDFDELAKGAIASGASVTSLTTQGQWLDRLGIRARAGALAARNPGRKEEIDAAVHRLCSADAMGELFKVIAIHSPGWPAPAGFQ